MSTTQDHPAAIGENRGEEAPVRGGTALLLIVLLVAIIAATVIQLLLAG